MYKRQVVNALVIDRAGNDRYEADIISEGVSDIRSFALLLLSLIHISEPTRPY